MSREARGAQLLDVAEKLFAGQGFDGTSMEDIARAAGVTRQVVYAHHPSKDAVFVACVRRARGELEAGIREPEIMIEAGAGMDVVIQRAGEIFFGLLERDPQRWAVLFDPGTALAPGPTEELATMRRRTIGRIEQMVRHFSPDDGAAADEVRDVAFAHAISGVGEQLGRWWIANPELPRERVIGLYRDFITGGLASRLPTKEA
ncbi:TetR/AcrR family transcriptional regulator [Actinomycetospora termitidis]|uniref:Helix-turn-helix domain-containing protein n=1 Tax=Actinomycetospora termitidis TaxID=3053470 RepID=A0ABT7MI56_9PSEU|nr:TetR/AcrR family transcriptional regulator [Actinomycetospora sp. Odt1-22]MDL5160350.1 helix-turn-helix domain-containing protein [Actinomycetospora sp. Odt1-22]